MIEIERIEIVTPIQGRTGTVMAQRVETVNGRTTYIEPVDLLIGFDGSQLPREVQQALSAIDTQQKSKITELTTERDTLRQRVTELEQAIATKTSEAESLQSQVNTLTEQAATLTATNGELTQRVTELEQEIAPKDAQIQQLQSQVEALQTEIDSLRNPPRPTSVTPAQIRVWLIMNVGPQVLDNIDTMLSQIPDEATRKIAKIKWEYGITVLRNDPLVVQFAQALGFDEQQMDRAFLEASQIG